ncbi:DUF4411 family protein [soil metagenome]
MTAYTLDANILIGLQQKYPKDIFPSAWEALEALVDDKRACICTDVHDEVNRGGDDLFTWAKELDGFVCEPTADDVQVAAQISAAHPGWVREAQNAADPFLIAHASAGGLVVVTEERRAGVGVTDKNQKVPNVAEEFGVEAISFFDLAREEGWKF